MKDLDEPGKTPYGLIYDSLIKRHSIMLNALLVISIIALTAATAFLISDILSFNSNDSPAELFSAFSFLNPLESEPVKNPVMAIADNSSLKDARMSQSPLNRSEGGKKALANDNPEMQTDPKSLKNSSLSRASISTRQLSGTIKAQSKPLNDDSPKPSKKKKHKSSSESSLQGTKVGAPASILAGITTPTPSQSRDPINLSDNLSMNLSPFEPEINAMEGHNNLSSQNNLYSTYDIDLESAANSSVESNITDENGDLGDASLNNVIPSEDSFEPQHLQSEMTDGGKEPANIAETLTPTPLSEPEEDKAVDRDLSQTQAESSTQEDSQVIHSSKFSPKSRSAKNDQINKRSKTAKGLKRTAPSAKLAKTRPARPTRDRSRH